MRPRRPLPTRTQVLQAAAKAPAPNTRRHRPDYIILVLSCILLAIGLIVVYSISPGLAKLNNVSENFYVTHQLITIGLALVAFGIIAAVPYQRFASMYKPLGIAALIVTFVALIMPVNPAYPAHRWISLGTFSFQSVELVKFALLIYLAAFLSKRMQDGTVSDFKATLKPLGMIIVAVGIIIAGIQSDLGSTGVILAIMGTMVFVAGLPMKKVIIFGLVVALLASVAIVSTPYRRDRFATYLNPEADCQNAGYQACQALVAVGSGGMAGLGLGRSVQAYGYLPESQNDSIFAIYAEKFGFIGSIGLLGLYAVFFGRLKRIIERAPDNYSRLVVIGITAWLSVQSLINIGAMIGLLPLKGITLPFVSYGGTSVVFIMAALGMVFNISRYTAHTTPRITGDKKEGRANDHRTNGGRFRGAYHPNPGSRL
ncbi:MAG: Stage sporulation protein [Candidatus Saccharibacteria bacterium]|nr:Stage sporulation protein [Candidatus Saccharibacteria bacterium]